LKKLEVFVFVFVRIERAGIGIYSKQKRHWSWRVLRKRATASGAFGKDATRSGAFQTRHYQWRVVIRIFELICFSLLFLIIIIY
jgi:hypothetical protein